MKRIVLALGTIVGLYLSGRAVAELFIIHWGNAASFRTDWGGPSLAGVLAVHCLPGLILPGYLAWWIYRKRAGDDAAPRTDRRAAVPRRPKSDRPAL